VPLPEADWVVVERLLAGDRSVRACASERDAAIDRLDGLGLSQQQIAVRLGVTMRTVSRRRAARRRLDAAS
jgi:DNA-directed RNA polymerase specialized sigma24 family protein